MQLWICLQLPQNSGCRKGLMWYDLFSCKPIPANRRLHHPHCQHPPSVLTRRTSTTVNSLQAMPSSVSHTPQDHSVTFFLSLKPSVNQCRVQHSHCLHPPSAQTRPTWPPSTPCRLCLHLPSGSQTHVLTVALVNTCIFLLACLCVPVDAEG